MSLSTHIKQHFINTSHILFDVTSVVFIFFTRMKSQQNKLSLGFQLQLKENIGEIGLMVWHRNSNLIKKFLIALIQFLMNNTLSMFASGVTAVQFWHMKKSAAISFLFLEQLSFMNATYKITRCYILYYSPKIHCYEIPWTQTAANCHSCVYHY